MEMFGGLRTEGWLFYLRNKVLNLALRPKTSDVGRDWKHCAHHHAKTLVVLPIRRCI